MFTLDKTIKLGILGGGQLGKMLIQEGVNLPLEFYVLDPQPDAPCSQICKNFTIGNFTNYNDVYNFGKTLDIVTIEIENVNTQALFQLQKEGVKVFPQPEVIETIKDKGLQKQFYQKNKFPTADFLLVDNKIQIQQNLNMLPCFQKLRTAGYDGYGVQNLQNEKDLEKAFDAPSVLEKYVNIAKEISVIVARNHQGEVNTFPIVELAFNPEANMVEFLFAPAQIDQTIANQATNIAKQLIESFNMIGLLAVEFFVTKDNKVLINEVAPRPHNSGHHTIEANMTSQYEQMLRAILNLPLGSTETIFPAVMVNLLGSKGYTGEMKINGLNKILNEKGVYVHLYGKSKTKPFRKMGHVTIIDDNLETAKTKALKIQQTLTITA